MMGHHSTYPAGKTRPPLAGADTIRRYSLSWLLRAASRVYERGAAIDRQEDFADGVSGLFDLSDTAQTGQFRRI
jgi:hypothetical protein